MRGIPSLVTDIRKKVFTEVARMAYAGGDYSNVEDLPYVIVPGDTAAQRVSISGEGYRWRESKTCHGPWSKAGSDKSSDDRRYGRGCHSGTA